MMRIFPALILLLSFGAHAGAQMASTGTVIGTVTDPSGAVVPSAQIELQDTTTGNVRTAVTNVRASIRSLACSREPIP